MGYYTVHDSCVRGVKISAPLQSGAHLLNTVRQSRNVLTCHCQMTSPPFISPVYSLSYIDSMRHAPLSSRRSRVNGHTLFHFLEFYYLKIRIVFQKRKKRKLLVSKMSFGKKRKKKEDEEGTKLTGVHSRIRVGKRRDWRERSQHSNPLCERLIGSD